MQTDFRYIHQPRTMVKSIDSYGWVNRFDHCLLYEQQLTNFHWGGFPVLESFPSPPLPPLISLPKISQVKMHCTRRWNFQKYFHPQCIDANWSYNISANSIGRMFCTIVFRCTLFPFFSSLYRTTVSKGISLLCVGFQFNSALPFLGERYVPQGKECEKSICQICL